MGSGNLEMFHCRIKRISDERYRALRSMSYPIFEQIPAFSYAKRYPDVDETPLNLAEYYAYMRIRFGESGFFYDDWKGVFSFPFEVEVVKNDRCHQYVVNVVNWRSTVELRFCKVFAGEEGFDASTYRQPNNDEFSNNEMKFVDGFLYGILLAYRKHHKFLEIPDFIRKIEMQSVILGYHEGQFFEKQYEDNDNFWEDVRRYPGLTTTAIREEKWPEVDEQGWIDVKSHA